MERLKKVGGIHRDGHSIVETALFITLFQSFAQSELSVTHESDMTLSDRCGSWMWVDCELIDGTDHINTLIALVAEYAAVRGGRVHLRA